MAIDLHTWDASLPSQFHPHEDRDFPSKSQNHNPSTTNNSNNNGLVSKPLVHFTEDQRNDMDDDFTAELTRQMAHFIVQDDDKLDFSDIGSDNLESSWDLIDSPQSTLWSPVDSNQRSNEGSSQEPSPPPTPGNRQDSCWKSTNDDIGMFEKMMLDEKANSKYQPGYGIHSSNNSNNIGLRSHQSLIEEQFQAIDLSGLKTEQVLSRKQKPTANRENKGKKSQQSEPKEQIQKFQKKGKGGGVGSGNGRRSRPPRPVPLQLIQSQHRQAGSGMQALFLGGSGSRGGTGVFLPPGSTSSTTSAPSESTTKKPGKGKGCSTVLIPARVVQALQQHFNQIAATSGPRAVGFPPLHDVLASNRDGMYSLHKRQSRKEPANNQNEMVLPQEWTY